MDTQADLLLKCGVTVAPEKKLLHWYPATIRVLGAERYELGSLATKVRFESAPGGFITRFPKEVNIPGSELMGKSIKVVTVLDVIIDCKFLQLSLASLHKGKYPLVLREVDTLHLVV